MSTTSALVDADQVLERRIWRARRRLETAADVDSRRAAWTAGKVLIRQRKRSP